MGIAREDNGFGVLKRRPWHEVMGLSDEERLIPLKISVREEKREQRAPLSKGHLIGYLCRALERGSGGLLWVRLLFTHPKPHLLAEKQRLWH